MCLATYNRSVVLVHAIITKDKIGFLPRLHGQTLSRDVLDHSPCVVTISTDIPKAKKSF
jgi:hypothetical protein